MKKKNIKSTEVAAAHTNLAENGSIKKPKLKQKGVKKLANMNGGGPEKTKPTGGSRKRKPNEVPSLELAKEEDKENTPSSSSILKKKKKLEEATNNSEEKESTTPAPSISHINKEVFDLFKRIQNSPLTQKTLNALIVLLKDEQSEETRLATCAYTLKRLVRSTGCDDKKSVATSASYIHAILTAVPNIDLFELLESLKRSLPIGSQQKGKEDSLAAVGQLITAFSIMETEHFVKQSSPKLIEAIYQILVGQLKGRKYLASMCADIMAESFKQIKSSIFNDHVWPLLKPHILVPIGEQKLQNCDLLLSVHLSYPKVLTRTQLEQGLWSQKPQYAQLFQLYLNASTIQSTEVYKRLSKFLDKELIIKWQNFIEKQQQPIKMMTGKACVLAVTSQLLLSYQEEDQKPLLELFTPNLIKLMVQELKQAKGEAKKAHQSELKMICRQLEGSLILAFEQHFQNDEIKLELLKRLLNEELILNGLMQTPRYTQVLINHLGTEARQGLYEFYQEILTENEKGERQLNRRLHSLNQMNLILGLPWENSKWQRQQMRNLLYTSLFHVNEKQKPCLKAEEATFSGQSSVVTRCQEIFFGILISKGQSLKELCKELYGQMEHLNKQFKKSKDTEQKLRLPREEKVKETWKYVEQVLGNPHQETEEVGQAFDALILFVGLDLCLNKNGPLTVMEDLIKCQKQAMGKKKDQIKDLKWQDVLTDALLLLLVQNGHYWREFVNLVAGSLVQKLGHDNFEQILDVLNMNTNPLSQNENEESEESDSSESEEDSDDEEEEKEDEEEEVTQLDQIREQVRLALVDNDASSVDWNDVDEAEGERLNAALERTFQAFKPHTSKSKRRPSRAERINSTSQLHFRVRALDLVELFVQKKPQLEYLLDALLCVYQVYKFSYNDAKLQSLREASLKLLRKLIQTKIVFDFKDSHKSALLEAIEHLMNPQAAQEQQPKGEVASWRDKCVAHLVTQFPDPQLVWPLLENYLQQWLTRRKSSLTLASFEAIFHTSWPGVTQLALYLSSHLNIKQTRSLRRYQILKLLSLQPQRLSVVFKDPSSTEAKEFEQHLANYTQQALTDKEFKKESKEFPVLKKILAQGGKKRSELLSKLLAS